MLDESTPVARGALKTDANTRKHIDDHRRVAAAKEMLPLVRLQAMKIVDGRAHPRFYSEIALDHTDPSVAVRVMATEHLTAEHEDVLLRLLHDEHPRLKVAAAHRLHALGLPSARSEQQV